MVKIKRTTAENEDFIALVHMLDIDLKHRDGEEHVFFAQFNTLENINYVVLAYDNKQAVACGAMKAFETNASAVEIKRMFVDPMFRSKGIAKAILNELEKWAREMAYNSCVLETGERQFEAVSLYQKCGYKAIPNFGPYVGVKTSRCFEKNIEVL